MSEPNPDLVPSGQPPQKFKSNRFLQIHWIIFEVAFIVFTIFELAKFFRYLYESW